MLDKIKNHETFYEYDEDGNPKETYISKIKYATAIKLAQDAVADIKKAGYNVSLEEIDTTNDYQIIIKLQK